MLDGFAQRGEFFHRIDFAVDFQALIPLFLQRFEFFFEFAFFAAGNRREQQKPGAERHFQNPVDHLRYGL